MNIFVYEHFTALEIGRDPGSPEHAIFREGRAMRDALVEDFRRVPGVEVRSVPDDAVPCDDDRFLREVERSDVQLVIAPELDGTLLALSILTATSGRSLGSTPDAIRLTSDKLALAGHWREHGVPTPATTDREPTRCEALPVVWKPRDGAGSTATFLLTTAFDLVSAQARLVAEKHGGPMVLQEFAPGQAASVAFLCGPRGNVPLVPALQAISRDGRFKYLGGELPIPPELADRAVRLAQRAVDCVPGLLGYVGVDVVLGDATDGSRDFAIEINPRLTTSYVGLRVLADFNIAGAMLKVARGEECGPLEWLAGRVRFAPDGSASRV